MIDKITMGVFLGIWGVWFVWELVLLLLRSKGGDIPKTISMVARDLGTKMNSVPYLWFGLGTHFWWNTSGWGGVAEGVAFWAMALVLIVVDFILRGVDEDSLPPPLRWFRQPVLWMVVGALAGRFLFPQAAT